MGQGFTGSEHWWTKAKHLCGATPVQDSQSEDLTGHFFVDYKDGPETPLDSTGFFINWDMFMRDTREMYDLKCVWVALVKRWVCWHRYLRDSVCASIAFEALSVLCVHVLVSTHATMLRGVFRTAWCLTEWAFFLVVSSQTAPLGWVSVLGYDRKTQPQHQRIRDQGSRSQMTPSTTLPPQWRTLP